MNYTGIKALIMGLGLHGGGLESARFMLKRGASVTVTDTRNEDILKPSIEQLDKICSDLNCKPVHYVLGKHEIDDFKNADIVIKNPGVKPDSPFLQISKRIETDLSLFLTESPARLSAVTGTKGKSVTSSALHWILSKNRTSGRAFLGGNITVCPLAFLDELTEDDDVILELSSFQLGDIKNHVSQNGEKLLKPKVSVLTSIMHDHLDRYATMERYIDDKRNIYRGQDASCITVAGDDDWGKSFRMETKARPIIWSAKKNIHSPLEKGQSGGWIDMSSSRGLACFYDFENQQAGETVELVPEKLLTPGDHQRLNMLMAALAAYGLGVKAQSINEALSSFAGIEHRLEFFHEANGIKFYNDSAATIPEAAAACIDALSAQEASLQKTHNGLVLVTGGTDKNLDFTPLANAAKKAKTVILLAGSGSEKLKSLLAEAGIKYHGPFENLDDAVRCAFDSAESKDVAALSPGCASFGMFLNEFDRGRKWKESVLRLG